MTLNVQSDPEGAGMFEVIERRPALAVEEIEYNRLLGFPRAHRIEGRSRELADASREWYAQHGRPWIYARQIESLELDNGRLRVGDAEFASEEFRGQLLEAGAHSAVVAAVSAGAECEERARQLWLEGKPDEYFFMEIFGSAVVEYLVAAAAGRLCAWADARGMAVLPHYSPGYSGWDIADQTRLWRLIAGPGNGVLPGPLEVMESGMPRPKKSLLAVFGLTRHMDRVSALSGLVPCERCVLAGCRYRRAPYRRTLPQVEDMQAAGGYRTSSGDGVRAGRGGLDPRAAYTVNAKALRKWSQERLDITHLADGSVQARFRYEGTTCSNMGRSLQFQYLVRLAGAESGYAILSAECGPVPGDTGHQFMCEYLSRPEELMGRIADEKPLLGRELNEVLQWRRQSSPAGCYCSEESRMHKWGLVLEVIHYALVHGGKDRRRNGHLAPGASGPDTL